MATGANTTPLGRLNPALGGKAGQSLLKPSYLQNQGISVMYQPPPMSMNKRELDLHDSSSNDSESAARKKSKRKSRWGNDDNDKSFIPGMPTIIPSNLNPNQEKAYLLQLQIEELSRRLRTGELGILPNPEERSPSPEPIYNNEGKRLNTREYRTRKKLEDDRHQLIQMMFDVNPEFKPPADYKPPVVRVSDKVMIPQEEHPDINFVGLLIGPRGNTLKAMEKETGAKIIIRGKGSVKEGKVGRKDGQPLPGEDEPLHAYVTANNPESVRKAVEKIKEIIRQGVEVPEGQNDLRRMQLRELALLNGTLRENDGPRCTNCGAANHKSWQCPDKPNVTNSVICVNCGGVGHIAKDCRERRSGSSPFGGNLSVPGMGEKSKIDEEYMSLMAELGEGPPPPTKSGGGPVSSGPGLFANQGPLRALTAPPPQPQSLMNQNVQPPWSGAPSMKPPAMMSMATVPPGTTPPTLPPPPGAPWQPPAQAPYPIPPPAMMLNAPPPPPPGAPGAAPSMPWMQQVPGNMPQNVATPWTQGPPVPVPPPPRPPPNVAAMPWQQGFMGVPPQPPLPGMPGPGVLGQSNTAGVDLHVLAAPPPPPPS